MPPASTLGGEEGVYGAGGPADGHVPRNMCLDSRAPLGRHARRTPVLSWRRPRTGPSQAPRPRLDRPAPAAHRAGPVLACPARRGLPPPGVAGLGRHQGGRHSRPLARDADKRVGGGAFRGRAAQPPQARERRRSFSLLACRRARAGRRRRLGHRPLAFLAADHRRLRAHASPRRLRSAGRVGARRLELGRLAERPVCAQAAAADALCARPLGVQGQARRLRGGRAKPVAVCANRAELLRRFRLLRSPEQEVLKMRQQ